MTKLEKYKKVTSETKKSAPSSLADLYEHFDAALKKLRKIDACLKSANGAAQGLCRIIGVKSGVEKGGEKSAAEEATIM